MGSFRIGIDIAAPVLGIGPGSPVDLVAGERLSTVYLPGHKITMLPESVVSRYTLAEKQLRPALSMYLDVADDFTVTSVSSRIEQVKVAANLRHDKLEAYFNEHTLSQGNLDHPFGRELAALWNFACKMEALRGKTNDNNNERIDYSFSVEDDRISITQRRRGSPIDKVVSELMIFVNAEWGKQLADGGVAGIYRSQGGGKVRMSTSPAPHQGLGVSQYAWASSPMRRYVDFINQRQLIALLSGETILTPGRARVCTDQCRISRQPMKFMESFSGAWNATGACDGCCRRISRRDGTSPERKPGETRSPAADNTHYLIARDDAGNEHRN